MNPPNLKKIIVQLENGLVITFARLVKTNAVAQDLSPYAAQLVKS